jgi:hypothetical protein
MKKLLFIAALTAASFTGFAQDEKEADKKLSFSIGLEAALPFGDFGDFSSFGIGGSAQGDYKVSPELAITLNAGYISYSAKTVSTIIGFDPVTFAPIYGDVKGDALGMVPVLAGIKYWFSSMIYGSGQLGLSFATGNGASGSNFTYAPGIGFQFSKFDVLLKYTGISSSGGGSSLSAVGLRAAYNF